MNRIALLVFSLLVGLAPACNTSRGGEPQSAVWTRAEWLLAARGFAANPATMPRLNAPSSQAVFQKLVTTKAWLDRGGVEVGGPQTAELMSFFPAFKALLLTLDSLNAVDESVVLFVFGLDVSGSIIGSAAKFTSGFPAEQQKTRLKGLETMRLGLAISLCGLLYLAPEATRKYQTRTFAWLTDPASYRQISRPGLQLILATLDERLIRSGPRGARQDYTRVRDVVATEHGKRPPPTSGIRTTYQGIAPPNPDASKHGTVVSTTGHFSVGLLPGAIAKRVQTDHPNGTTSTQHWVELQAGLVRFEAVCADETPEAEFVAIFAKASGSKREQSDLPGHWFAYRQGEREGRTRVLTLGGRACMVSAEGPPGHLPKARVDAVLSSLRAVP